VHHQLHQRALHLAAEVLGGDENLRIHLGASEGEFASWCGPAELPKTVFLRLVDIITGEEQKTRRR
jgi:hypothetical protein